jgi:hypothetical protein
MPGGSQAFGQRPVPTLCSADAPGVDAVVDDEDAKGRFGEVFYRVGMRKVGRSRGAGLKSALSTTKSLQDWVFLATAPYYIE